MNGYAENRLDGFWIVVDGTPNSELVDVIYWIISPNHLARVAIGTGLGRWVKEHTAFYTDEAFVYAIADAMDRLKKAGSSWPDQYGNFTMAQARKLLRD